MTGWGKETRKKMALKDQSSNSEAWVLAATGSPGRLPAVPVPQEMGRHLKHLHIRNLRVPQPAPASVASAASPASPCCCKWHLCQQRWLEESRENKCCSFNSNFLARNPRFNSKAEVQWMQDLFIYLFLNQGLGLL